MAIDDFDRDDVPPPFLNAPPRWHPGTWGLPSQTISYVSILAAAFTAAWLLIPDTRILFRLPVSPFVSCVVAGIAWTVAFRTAHRPGPLLPRRWALMLALVTTAAALLSFIPPEAWWVHVLITVGAVAVVPLLLRLCTIHPFSALALHAPLVAFALGIVSAYGAHDVQGRSVDSRTRALTDIAAHLEDTTQRLNTAVQVETLGATALSEIKPADLTEVKLRTTWQHAELVGVDDLLHERVLAYSAAVTELLRQAPSLNRSTVRYEPETNQWETHDDFDNRLRDVTAYHRAAERFVSALTTVTIPEQAADDVLDAVRDLRGQWVTHAFASIYDPTYTQADIETAFQLDMAKNPVESAEAQYSSRPRFRPIDIRTLLQLTPSEAEDVLGSGCDHVGPYPEAPYWFERFDCYTHRVDGLPDDEVTGDWIISVRLVWRRGNQGNLPNARPYQLYYLVNGNPENRDLATDAAADQAFAGRIMQHFCDSIEAHHGDASLRLGRADSCTNGFDVKMEGRLYQVTRPVVEQGNDINAMRFQIFN